MHLIVGRSCIVPQVYDQKVLPTQEDDIWSPPILFRENQQYCKECTYYQCTTARGENENWL